MYRAWMIAGPCAVCLSSNTLHGQAYDLPVGTVSAWLKDYANTPPLPAGWLECNGQVVNDPSSPYNGQSLPNLTARFLRGNAVSGATGGSDSHNHQWILNGGGSAGGWASNTHSAKTWNSNASDLQAATTPGNFYTSMAADLPSYYEVVWIMKIKEPPPAGVPAVSTWGLMILGVLVLAVGSILMRRRSIGTGQ